MHNKIWNKHRTPQWEQLQQRIDNNRTAIIERRAASATWGALMHLLAPNLLSR